MSTQTPTRHDADRAPAAARRDCVWAAGAAVVALVVYVRTLAPGLVGEVDTPMFQFVGRVLGVAHNPGYPLYVFLTFPFSFLPIGSLAYRINLFSALLGAVTVALTFLLARRLGCRRMVALTAALGLAFGPVFWSQAIIAEVYTLHAAIVAGILLSLLLWSDTQRPAYYYIATAVFAAGLGNHTTIVGFAPGIAIFVLLTNRPFALRWRTVAFTLALLALGLLQYSFILIRSLDPDAYLESRATTMAQLADVMMAGQFRDRLFTVGWRTVLFDRLPFLFERVLVSEMTLPALLVAAVGAVWLLRRRLSAALLLLLGMAAVLAFAINYSVVDTPVFVIPAFLILWIVAATGIEQLARVAGRFRDAAWPGMAVAVIALGIPAWLLAHNFAHNDRSRDTETQAYLDALLDALPDGSILVREDFLVDRIVIAGLFGDDGIPDRRIDFVERDARNVKRALLAGPVYGFGKSARRLRYDALNFRVAPEPLVGRTFPEFLGQISRGAAVALAIPGRYANRFAASEIALRVVGGTGAADRVVGRGQRIGDSAVVAQALVDLHADATSAVIKVGNRDVVRAVNGIAVAVFTPAGRLDETFVLQPDAGFRVPLAIGPLSIYALRDEWHGTEISADDWRNVTGACQTGSVMLRIPAAHSVVLYVTDDRPLEPRPFDSSQDGIVSRITEVLPGFMPRGRAYRIEIGASSARAASVLLALGGIPSRVLARLTPQASPRRQATIFSVDIAGLLRMPDRQSEILLMARDDQSQLTGDGWSSVDSDGIGPYRWMTATESRLVLPVANADATHVRVQAFLHGAHQASPLLAIRINETALSPQPIQPGWRGYEWELPERLLRRGINELAIVLDRQPGVKTIAVSDVRLERRP